MRGQLAQASRVQVHDLIMDGNEALTVAHIGGHPGRKPKDGNHKIDIQTYDGTSIIVRINDAVRMVPQRLRDQAEACLAKRRLT